MTQIRKALKCPRARSRELKTQLYYLFKSETVLSSAKTSGILLPETG